MRIIAKRTLREFWQSKPEYLESRGQLEAWHHEVLKADWSHPRDIKARFRNASFLRGNRVVFNICGNKYRRIVRINYAFRIVYIRFVGTHRDYDRIDARNI